MLTLALARHEAGDASKQIVRRLGFGQKQVYERGLAGKFGASGNTESSTQW